MSSTETLRKMLDEFDPKNASEAFKAFCLWRMTTTEEEVDDLDEVLDLDAKMRDKCYEALGWESSGEEEDCHVLHEKYVCLAERAVSESWSSEKIMAQCLQISFTGEDGTEFKTNYRSYLRDRRLCAEKFEHFVHTLNSYQVRAVYKAIAESLFRV